MNEEFPKTYFLDIAGHENLLGRLIITPIDEKFMVEIDIVLKESQKIMKHVNILYNISELDEAKDIAVQHLSSSFQ